MSEIGSATTWLGWRVLAVMFLAGLTASVNISPLKAAAANSASPAKPPISLLLDASQSMSGYVRSPDASRRPIGDIIALAKEFASTTGMPLVPKAFGTELQPILGDLNVWGTPAPYECKGSSKCINKESHIDQALASIRAMPPGSLSILVSDFWFDNQSFSGAPAVALGVPLRAILSNRAVAVVGLRAPFQGAIYDMPGIGTYKAAKERVLIVLLAGPETKIADFVRRLRASGSSSFAGMHYTMFRVPGQALRVAPPQPVGAGIRPLSGTPGAWEIDWDDAGRSGAAKGRLVGQYDLEKLLPATTVWRGKLLTSTTLLRETGGKWSPYTQFGKTWQPGPGAYSSTFAFGTHVGNLPSGKYLLKGQIGTDGISSPDKAAAWMRDWSLSPNPGTPSFVYAMGLSQVADILEGAVSRRAVLAEFTQRVDIED